MSNAIIFGIWHTKHQKRSFIRCIKLLQHATVFFQFWPGINEEWHMVYYFFIHLSLSSLFTLFITLVSHSSLDIKLHSFLLSLFFLLNLVVFLSSSQTSPSVFSSLSFLLSLLSLSLWFFFFFLLGSDLILNLAVGGLRW